MLHLLGKSGLNQLPERHSLYNKQCCQLEWMHEDVPLGNEQRNKRVTVLSTCIMVPSRWNAEPFPRLDSSLENVKLDLAIPQLMSAAWGQGNFLPLTNVPWNSGREWLLDKLTTMKVEMASCPEAQGYTASSSNSSPQVLKYKSKLASFHKCLHGIISFFSIYSISARKCIWMFLQINLVVAHIQKAGLTHCVKYTPSQIPRDRWRQKFYKTVPGIVDTITSLSRYLPLSSKDVADHQNLVKFRI